MSDYDSVVRILNQGQALHINWRPDIYKPNDALLPKAVFEEIVKGDTFYIAENEGNVIGILELIFRHIESPAQVTRDIVFIDTMAVDEPYRGMGVGHLFFEKVKEIKAEKNLDGIELQVNAKNKAAYEMYCNYGFTEKSIHMVIVERAFLHLDGRGTEFNFYCCHEYICYLIFHLKTNPGETIA